jgi:hypothetical protein
MTLEAGVDSVKCRKLLDGKVPPQCENRVERDRGVPLAQDQAIATGIVWVLRINSESIKVEVDQDIGNREWAPDVSCTRMMYRLENEFARLHRERREIF